VICENSSFEADGLSVVVVGLEIGGSAVVWEAYPIAVHRACWQAMDGVVDESSKEELCRAVASAARWLVRKPSLLAVNLTSSMKGWSPRDS